MPPPKGQVRPRPAGLFSLPDIVPVPTLATDTLPPNPPLIRSSAGLLALICALDRMRSASDSTESKSSWSERLPVLALHILPIPRFLAQRESQPARKIQIPRVSLYLAMDTTAPCCWEQEAASLAGSHRCTTHSWPMRYDVFFFFFSSSASWGPLLKIY